MEPLTDDEKGAVRMSFGIALGLFHLRPMPHLVATLLEVSKKIDLGPAWIACMEKQLKRALKQKPRKKPAR